MYIANVENSEIDVSGIRTVLVQGDSAYPSIRFVLDPSLTGLSWRVRGTYLSSNIAVTSPELVATETASSVSLDWSVASDFTAYNGEMQLSLVGSNELGTVITKALGEITIQKDYSLGEHQTITLDLFEQLMAQADATISKYPYIDEASGNWFVWNPTLGAWEDTGESANGAPSYWYTGTTITGTETTPTAFPSSGITQARYGDMYLNSDTSNVYRCTSGGDAATALWSYQTNIKGAQGDPGADGTDGVGVPTGGTANQLLGKVDGTDYNTSWRTVGYSDVGAAPSAHASQHAIGGSDALNALPYNAIPTSIAINGGFDHWQRGTSFNATGYTADRWKMTLGTSQSITATRQAFTIGQSDVPGNPTYYAQLAISNAGSANGVFEQRIEGVSIGANGSVAYSFYAKCDATTYAAQVQMSQNFGSGGSSEVALTAQNITLTTTWQKFGGTFSLPSISGKTVGTSSYLTFKIIIPTASGTKTIVLSNVQINYGSIVLPYVPRNTAEEFRMCMRYYTKLRATIAYSSFVSDMCTLTGALQPTIALPVPMRATPASVFSGAIAMTNGTDTKTVDGSTSGTMSLNDTGVQLSLVPTSGSLTVNTVYKVYANNDANAYIALSSEL